MHFSTIVRLHNAETKDSIGFGRGIVQLLLGVQEYGSLNKATKTMGMAYSKAWRLLNETEEEFGIKLLERDGAHGSALTPEAVKMLDVYDKMLKAANDAATKVFEKYYK